MKKFFIGITAVLFLCSTALTIFFLTFDLDRYRPFLVKKVEEAMGVPVSIGRLSLAWQGGIAVSAERVAVHLPSSKQAVATVDKATVTVRFMPLLNRQVEIASVLLSHPILHIERGADGQLILPMPAPQPVTPAGRSSSKPAPPLLSVDNVRVDNAEIEFLDHSQNPARRLLLRDTDARVKNFSMTRPFSFSARAALFSQKQDISVAGSFVLAQGRNPAVLKKADLSADLSLVDLGAAAQFFPQITQSGMQNIGGTLVVSMTDLSLNQASLANLRSDLSFDKGRVSLKSLKIPVTSIRMHASVAQNTANIDSFTADIGSGKIKAFAKISGISSDPYLSFDLNLVDLLLAELAPPRTDAPGLSGVLALRLSANADPADMAHTLKGSGALSLKEGVIHDFNIMREILSRISVIPGITDTLMQRLPEAYKQKISSRDTALMPVDLPFNITNGALVFNNLRVQTDHFVVLGAGQSDMSGQVLGQAAIRISPELSNAMRQSVPQLFYFMDSQGQVEIPFRFKGRLPKPVVLPDMDALAPKLAVAGTQEVLSRVLSKVTKRNEGNAQATPTDGSVQTGASSEDALARLLKKALS